MAYRPPQKVEFSTTYTPKYMAGDFKSKKIAAPEQPAGLTISSYKISEYINKMVLTNNLKGYKQLFEQIKILVNTKIVLTFYVHVSYGSNNSKPVNISLFMQNGNRIIISARVMLSGLNIVYQLSVNTIFVVLMLSFRLINSVYAPVNIPWFEGELITLF